jgi:hypothetical protein
VIKPATPMPMRMTRRRRCCSTMGFTGLGPTTGDRLC